LLRKSAVITSLRFLQAKQSSMFKNWIASSQKTLLAMTEPILDNFLASKHLARYDSGGDLDNKGDVA